MNVMGEIKPCHNPIQKPAIFPSLFGVFSISLGPPAQLESRKKQIQAKIIQAAVFIFSSPLGNIRLLKN